MSPLKGAQRGPERSSCAEAPPVSAHCKRGIRASRRGADAMANRPAGLKVGGRTLPPMGR
jgi:hypothetical protein